MNQTFVDVIDINITGTLAFSRNTTAYPLGKLRLLQ